MSAALREAALCARAVAMALRTPEEEAEALDWYETLRDGVSGRLLAQSEA